MTAQPLDAQQSVTKSGAKTTQTKKRRSPLLDPAAIVTGVMLLLVAELALWVAVGWLWWAVINVAVALVVVAAVLAWRRRTPGGWLDRLFGGRSRSGGTSKTSTTRTTSRTGAPGRGLLGRLLPGRGRGGAHPGGGRARSGLGGLLPGGGGRSGGRPAAGGSSTAGQHRGSGGRGKTSPGTGGGSPKKNGKSAGSALRDFWHGLTDPEEPKPNQPKPKPTAEPAGTDQRETAPTQKGQPTVVRHEEDASLQRWGRNLKTISPAIEELLQAARQQDELAEAIASGVSKLAVQGESELPADRALVAEAEAIAAELRELMTDDRAGRLARLRDRADELARSYGRRHEVDEARLAGERGGRAREKRADVSAAERDT